MTRLARYVFGRWAGLSLLLLLVVGGVLLALTVVESLRWTRDVPLGQVLHWVALQVPAVMVRVLPVAVLTASAIVVGELVASREALAMRAGGVRVARVLRPWWPTLLVVAGAGLAASEWLVPVAEQRAAELWWRITEDRSATFRLARRELHLPGGITLRFERYDDAGDRLLQVRVRQVNATSVEVVRAASATWDGAVLHVEGGDRVTLALGALDRSDLDAESTLAALAAGPQPVETVTLSETRAETVARLSGGTVGDGRSMSRHWQVANDPGSSYGARRWAALMLHEKLASAFGSLSLALATAVIGLRYASSVTMAFGFATAVGLSWFVLIAAGQWLVVAGLLPPWLGPWGVHLLVLGVTLLASARR